jgi:hypothetical protein
MMADIGVDRYVLDVPGGFAFIDVAGDDVSGRVLLGREARELDLTKDRLLIETIAKRGKQCVGSGLYDEPPLGKPKIEREVFEWQRSTCTL